MANTKAIGKFNRKTAQSARVFDFAEINKSVRKELTDRPRKWRTTK